MTEDYLYHYTNTETLALILSNKTIRFNSLNNVDDLQEQETSDVKNFGQYCFVSCWTDDAEESIPMWKMYGNFTSGIRIKMKKYPFLERATVPYLSEDGLEEKQDNNPSSGRFTQASAKKQESNTSFLSPAKETAIVVTRLHGYTMVITRL